MSSRPTGRYRLSSVVAVSARKGLCVARIDIDDVARRFGRGIAGKEQYGLGDVLGQPVSLAPRAQAIAFPQFLAGIAAVGARPFLAPPTTPNPLPPPLDIRPVAKQIVPSRRHT